MSEKLLGDWLQGVNTEGADTHAAQFAAKDAEIARLREALEQLHYKIMETTICSTDGHAYRMVSELRVFADEIKRAALTEEK